MPVRAPAPASSGYSGTPLARKLGIQAGTRVALIHAPANFRAQLAPIPPGVAFYPAARGTFDVIVLFVDRRAELARRFARLAQALTPAGGLWVAWPKRASHVPTDLAEPAVREVGLAAGLVDNKVAAIDAIWAGLRFVRRRVDR